jgi:hypothetical protein
MMRNITKADVRQALWLLQNATGKKIDADGVGSYQLRAVDSTGAAALFEQINPNGGLHRLASSITAKTKREQYILLTAYRAGIQDATEVKNG